MPAYIVKIRKPEEVRVNNKSFYKIRLTKNGQSSNHVSNSHTYVKNVNGSSYLLYDGKNGNRSQSGSFVTKCIKYPNGKCASSPLLPVNTNSNLFNNKVTSNGTANTIHRDPNNNNNITLDNNAKLEDKECIKIKADFLDDFKLNKSCSEERRSYPPPRDNKSPKLCQIISHSAAKQVDDVIEEILNLEEGLEAGNNLKKCDSQTSLTQSQSDNVPDTICDLLGLNGFMGGKTSASCPSDVPKVKTEPTSTSDPQVVAFMKDRQKKDNHNMIERRRRFNINDRIRDLSQLLPKNNEPYVYPSQYHEIVRDIRHNKGQILRASVDYIRRLKSDLEVSKAAEDKRRALEQQNRQLLIRVQELENQLRMNGIKVEETKIDSNLLLPSITQSEVMSPTSTTVSPTTSPFNPTPTTSPFTPIPNHTTSPPLNPVNAGNFTTTTCSSESDLTDFNLCDEHSMTSADTTNLLNDLGVADPDDAKKVKCQGAHLPDFLLEDLLMDDFPAGNFGLNLMDDDSLAFTSDPMFSSPQVSSPNSSRHSFEDALTPDSMDIVS